MEPSRGTSICVPFESEDHDEACIAETECLRGHLGALHRAHPELFPERFVEGFRFHDMSWSIKQQLWTSRIELTATGQLFQIRPSFLMSYMVTRTEAVEKALCLRHWTVPFDVLCDVFGRNPMFWYRAEVALGRPSIVGSTVKPPQRLPQDLLVDEKHTRAFGHKVYVPTTVRGACILGAAVAKLALAEALEAAYGAIACLQPPDGLHRRLGRHAKCLEEPLSDRLHHPPEARASPCAPWPCSGTSIRTGPAVAATIGRAARPSRDFMASSITPTGFTTCSLLPPWEDEDYEPRNPIESGHFQIKCGNSMA
jgi:hypothetical protein